MYAIKLVFVYHDLSKQDDGQSPREYQRQKSVVSHFIHDVVERIVQSPLGCHLHVQFGRTQLQSLVNVLLCLDHLIGRHQT